MSVNGGPAAPQTVNIYERQIIAMELRKQGKSYRNIAKEVRAMVAAGQICGMATLKYSETLAHKDVMSALKRLTDKVSETAEQTRRMELERLDDLWIVYFAKALAGDGFAMNSCMQLMARRANLLGLNVPVNNGPVVNVNVGVTADEMAAAREKAKAMEEQMLGSEDKHGS